MGGQIDGATDDAGTAQVNVAHGRSGRHTFGPGNQIDGGAAGGAAIQGILQNARLTGGDIAIRGLNRNVAGQRITAGCLYVLRQAGGNNAATIDLIPQIIILGADFLEAG